MYKGCENCGNYYYHKGPEDIDEGCLKYVDINIVPEKEENKDYKCPNWKKIKDTN